MFNQKNRTGTMLHAAMLALLAGTTIAYAQDSGLGGFLEEEFNPASDMGGPGSMGLGDMPMEGQGEPPADSGSDADLNFAVEVDDFDQVDLHVNNEELGRVLQLLSIQSERNIVASPQVSATITADLYSVTFYEALDAILHVNGFGYIEQGNFIYVYTREELEAIEIASREMESKVVSLQYLTSIDAAEFVKNLLSAEGAITTSVGAETFPTAGESPIGADTYANTALLVIHDYQENIDSILSLLAELDTKPIQVLVEATILQTSVNELNAFGMDFSVLNNINFSDFAGSGGPLGVVSGLIAGNSKTADGTVVNAPSLASGNGAAIGSSIGNVGGNASLRVGLVNEDVAVFLRLLDQVTDTTVISNPKILTLNRQAGRVLVGTRVGYLSTTSTETATTQSVEFLDVGTQLSVRPFISDSGVIRLELRPQVSSANLREVAGATGGSVTIPDEDTTEMTTNVMVRDGQTVVLGGLFTETTTATRRQIPVLGNIPMIGKAFQGHDDQTRRSEIIFMITPSIVNDTMMDEDGQRATDYIESITYGARMGTLIFGRERRVGQMLVDARNLANLGHTEEAISKIRRALSQYPSSPDARMMLEELTGDHTYSPTRSVLEGIFRKEMLSDQQFHPHRETKIPPPPPVVAEPALHYEPISTDPIPPVELVEPTDYTPVDMSPVEIDVETPAAQQSFDAFQMEPLEPFTAQPPAEWPQEQANHKFGDIEQFDAVVETPAETGGDWDGWDVAAPVAAEPVAVQAPIEPLPQSENWDWSGVEQPANDSAIDAITTTVPVTEPAPDLAPQSDIYDVITTPETTEWTYEPADAEPLPQAETQFQPLDTTPQGVDATGADNGFLYVPMPGGGAVRVPWPMNQQARGVDTEWQQFTSVPTDEPVDEAIQWED